MAGKTGKVARIRVTAATPTSSTNNAATLSTSGLVLTIDSTALRHWNRASSTHVKVFEGVTDRTTDIASINYVQGKVTFDTAHSTASAWTVDAETLTSSYLGEGRDWSVDIAVDLLDRTAFSTGATDTAWRTFTPSLAGGTITIDRFWAGTTGPAFFDRLNTEQDTVVELWTDSALTEKFETFAFVEGDSFTVPIDELAAESVTLRAATQIYTSTA